MPFVPAQASLGKISQASPEDHDKWSTQLEGKRLVTSDMNEVRQTLTSWTQVWTSKVRIFYCSPSIVESPSDNDQRESPFFALPVELRLEILEIALRPQKQGMQLIPGHRAEMHRSAEKSTDPTRSLLLTCKKLYFEFLPIALKLKTFPVRQLPPRYVLHYTPESFKLLADDAVETTPR